MTNSTFFLTSLICILWTGGQVCAQQTASTLRIGWATSDITPDRPVLIRGQFHARLSEGIKDPITATALALESASGNEKIVMISCDLIGIDDILRDRVRKLVTEKINVLSPEAVFLNATHTHEAPLTAAEDKVEEIYGLTLKQLSPDKPMLTPANAVDFLATRIAGAAVKAWNGRKPGGISFGLGTAVLGHNRLQVRENGKSLMYGNTSDPAFRYIEGYEDHQLNLLCTWSEKKQLTGIVINAAVPAQVSEHLYEISADYWHEARAALRKEFGSDLYVFPQVSAAGDQSPHTMWAGAAEERMHRLMGFDSNGKGRGADAYRHRMAFEVTKGVKAVFPALEKSIEWNPVVKHTSRKVPLARRLLSDEDVVTGDRQAEEWKAKYEALLEKVNNDPEYRKQPRWYRDITVAFTQYRRGKSVRERFGLEKTSPQIPVEVHAVRIGDMAMVSNPFELYLDYGIQIKTRSRAVQTFVVQLAGFGTYLPTQRSIEGGAYGAVPASTLVGPEAGKQLVDASVEMIGKLWEE